MIRAIVQVVMQWLFVVAVLSSTEAFSLSRSSGIVRAAVRSKMMAISGNLAPRGSHHTIGSFHSRKEFGRLAMAENSVGEKEGEVEEEGKFDPAAWLNPNTRGGVIVWSLILVTIPVLVYQYFVSTGLEPTKVGGYVGALFVLLSNVLWASTYVFRVANKDMTYAQQLRDYENAVLQKRLDELDDDEIDALLGEIEDEAAV
jgi:hypothetical protein